MCYNLKLYAKGVNALDNIEKDEQHFDMNQIEELQKSIQLAQEASENIEAQEASENQEQGEVQNEAQSEAPANQTEEVIPDLAHWEEFSKENILFLHSIEDKKFVLEILLKELVIAKDFELTVVIFLISEFATLELAEEKIWEELKNPNIEDSQKGIYLNLLRALGGKVDIQELANHMNDFQSVVDAQTQDLLETATINPEAQIDFLDFLMSLNDKEQLQLIYSLEDDFPGDELANIVSPCLRIRMSEKNKEQIITILGNSKSYLAILFFVL